VSSESPDIHRLPASNWVIADNYCRSLNNPLPKELKYGSVTLSNQVMCIRLEFKPLMYTAYRVSLQSLMPKCSLVWQGRYRISSLQGTGPQNQCMIYEAEHVFLIKTSHLLGTSDTRRRAPGYQQITIPAGLEQYTGTYWWVIQKQLRSAWSFLIVTHNSSGWWFTTLSEGQGYNT